MSVQSPANASTNPLQDLANLRYTLQIALEQVETMYKAFQGGNYSSTSTNANQHSPTTKRYQSEYSSPAGSQSGRKSVPLRITRDHSETTNGDEEVNYNSDSANRRKGSTPRGGQGHQRSASLSTQGHSGSQRASHSQKRASVPVILSGKGSIVKQEVQWEQDQYLPEKEEGNVDGDDANTRENGQDQIQANLNRLMRGNTLKNAKKVALAADFDTLLEKEDTVKSHASGGAKDSGAFPFSGGLSAISPSLAKSFSNMMFDSEFATDEKVKEDVRHESSVGTGQEFDSYGGVAGGGQSEPDKSTTSLPLPPQSIPMVTIETDDSCRRSSLDANEHIITVSGADSPPPEVENSQETLETSMESDNVGEQAPAVSEASKRMSLTVTKTQSEYESEVRKREMSLGYDMRSNTESRMRDRSPSIFSDRLFSNIDLRATEGVKKIKAKVKHHLYEGKYDAAGSANSLSGVQGTFLKQFALKDDAIEDHASETNLRFQGFHPRSSLIVNWELFISVIYGLALWFIPISTSFEKNDYLVLPTSLCCTIIYLLDTARFFFTLHIELPDQKKRKTKKIDPAQDSRRSGIDKLMPASKSKTTRLLNLRESQYHYLTTDFAIDLITVVPWDAIFYFIPNWYLLLYIKLIRLRYLGGILRSSPYYRALRRSLEDFLGVGQSFSTIFYLAGALVAFLHLEACGIFLLARLTGYTYSPIGDVQYSPVGAQYSYAIFQAVANTFPLAYKPTDSTEQWFIVIFVITGAVLYATIVGTISAFSFGLDPSARLYKQKLDEFNDYLEYKNIPEEVRRRVRHYFELKYRGKFFEESTLLKDLNDSLRQEIAIHNSRELISKVPFLNRQMGDGRDEWFFGRIATSLQAVFMIIPRTATIAAGTNCILYKLSRDDFLPIIKEFEDVKAVVGKMFSERMEKVKKEEEERQQKAAAARAHTVTNSE
ncbi:hypothetical protein HDU76_007286 [Blyttiomyces sp. JEL0837]|nr:hypothetical protein HDU76_007286 [Blyttiomyces sp. JEL0837]